MLRTYSLDNLYMLSSPIPFWHLVLFCGVALTALVSAARAADAFTGSETAAFPVSIHADASKKSGELTPIWRFFGYDEANYTYMKDVRKLLAELGQLDGQQVFIRCNH